MLTSRQYTISHHRSPHPIQDTLRLLARRGPNQSFEHRCHINAEATTEQQQCLQFYGHVLWQQGIEPCRQPIVRQVAGQKHCNRVLLLNGDLYTKRTNIHQSDTEWLMNCLEECKVIIVLRLSA